MRGITRCVGVAGRSLQQGERACLPVLLDRLTGLSYIDQSAVNISGGRP